jgi:hypothetical protein
MNETEKAIRDTLEALGLVNRLFRDAASSLGRLPQVKSVATALEIMSYENGSRIEGYVDAELQDGNGISWLLDVQWNADSWTIRATLEKNSAAGNEVIEQLPPANIADVELLPEALTGIAKKLLDFGSEGTSTANKSKI